MTADKYFLNSVFYVQFLLGGPDQIAQGAWLHAGRPEFECRRIGDFLHSFVSRVVLESAQPPVK